MHTQQWVVNKHTHTHWTQTRSSGQPFMLLRPGSSWGYGPLLKGLTSVVVLRVERALDIHSPPPTIPAGPETRTSDLWVTSPTLYPLGHNCPVLQLGLLWSATNRANISEAKPETFLVQRGVFTDTYHSKVGQRARLRKWKPLRESAQQRDIPLMKNH